MKTSIPACEAGAIVMGAGALTGRYRKAPPWGPGEFHVEMWNGKNFIWCSLAKTDMETPGFKSRLAGELQLVDCLGLKFTIDQAWAILSHEVQLRKCALGFHDFEFWADGDGGRVKKCRRCPKLYAYKMPYWFGDHPKPDGFRCIHETRSGMEEHAFAYLRAWVGVESRTNEVFGGDLSRPGIVRRYWIGDDYKLHWKEEYHSAV